MLAFFFFSYIYTFFIADNIFISMYIMCVILCLFSTLSCKLGALQISIIIITTAKHFTTTNKEGCVIKVTGLGTHAKLTETERALCGSHVHKKGENRTQNRTMHCGSYR